MIYFSPVQSKHFLVETVDDTKSAEKLRSDDNAVGGNTTLPLLTEKGYSIPIPIFQYGSNTTLLTEKGYC